MKRVQGVGMKRGKELVGKYEIGRFLGKGTFSKVYRAKDTETTKIVAIKVISKTNTKIEEYVKREIGIMRMLQHPNIVKLFDVIFSEEKIYLVMEYVRGGDLVDKIRKGKLDEEEARSYFRQLITTVDFCHRRGVYHRDLKLENVLVGENGVLKVADFGLGALAASKWKDGMLHTSCGTPQYMAPEVLSNIGYDGAKADIWSCGVILYTLLAGGLPFNEGNLQDMTKKICIAEYIFPKWFSDEARSLLFSIFNPNPHKRILISEIKETSWYKKEATLCMPGITELTEEKEPSLLSSDAGSDIMFLSTKLDLSHLFKICMIRVASVCSPRLSATHSS